jgi:hypothetical protein
VVVALRLPAVTASAWDALAPVVEVPERAALLLMARLKKEATRCLERGDREGALRHLGEARQPLGSAPPTPVMEPESQALAQIEAHIESGAWTKFLKHATYQAHQRRSSKPYP